jgi:hypothetical protein
MLIEVSGFNLETFGDAVFLGRENAKDEEEAIWLDNLNQEAQDKILEWTVKAEVIIDEAKEFIKGLTSQSKTLK